MLACEGGPAVSYIYPGDGHVGVRVEVSALSKALEYYFRKETFYNGKKRDFYKSKPMVEGRGIIEGSSSISMHIIIVICVDSYRDQF